MQKKNFDLEIQFHLRCHSVHRSRSFFEFQVLADTRRLICFMRFFDRLFTKAIDRGWKIYLAERQRVGTGSDDGIRAR